MADRDYELEDVLETYRRDGSLIKEKARVLVEEWLDKIYPRLTDVDTSTAALLDIGKALIELGDLKPKANAQPASIGPNFSISINIPQGGGAEPITITGEVVEPPSSSDLDEPETTQETDELPEGRNFNLPYYINADLTANQPTEPVEPAP